MATIFLAVSLVGAFVAGIGIQMLDDRHPGPPDSKLKKSVRGHVLVGSFVAMAYPGYLIFTLL